MKFDVGIYLCLYPAGLSMHFDDIIIVCFPKKKLPYKRRFLISNIPRS